MQLRINIENDEYILNDNGSTLAYIDENYEMNASDVKMCITNVIQQNGFSLRNKTIYTVLKREYRLDRVVFDMLACMRQLVNMHVFFDNPNE